MIGGISWLDAAPAVMRYLERAGEVYAARESCRLTGFWIGGDQPPILKVMTEALTRLPAEGPLAWYVRLPDPAGFLKLVAPVLNRRLADSVVDGWSGRVSINFYQAENHGLTLVLEQGRLVCVENTALAWHEDAAMPVEAFNRILFGYRSVDEVEAESAEVVLKNTSRVVLRALFPKQFSRIFSIA
jgi:hypothetical protein